MGLVNLLKKGATICAYIAAANQVAMPLLVTIGTPTVPSYMVTNTHRIEEHSTLPEDFDAIDYLNVASSLVHNDSHGDGDCSDYTIATYTVYMQLAELNGRRDLKSKIRTVTAHSVNIGHMWIEIERDGNFVPYESTAETPSLSIGDIKEYSAASLDERMQISSNPKTKDNVFFRSFRGSRLGYPTLKSLLFPGGVVRMMYEAPNSASE